MILEIMNENKVTWDQGSCTSISVGIEPTDTIVSIRIRTLRDRINAARISLHTSDKTMLFDCIRPQ